MCLVDLASAPFWMVIRFAAVAVASVVTAFTPGAHQVAEAVGDWYFYPREHASPAFYYQPDSQSYSLLPPVNTPTVKLWRTGLMDGVKPPQESMFPKLPPVWTQAQLDAARPRLLLVILGHIFDVSTGERHYGGESGYSIFVGRECSGAFVSGNFEPDHCTPSPHQSAAEAVANYTPPSPSAASGLRDWLSFYLSHETYTFEGVLAPSFYISEGGHYSRRLTDVFDASASAVVAAAAEAALSSALPSCNYKYTQGSDPEWWCDRTPSGARKQMVLVRWRVPSFSPTPKVRCACTPRNVVVVDPRVTHPETAIDLDAFVGDDTAVGEQRKEREAADAASRDAAVMAATARGEVLETKSAALGVDDEGAFPPLEWPVCGGADGEMVCKHDALGQRIGAAVYDLFVFQSRWLAPRKLPQAKSGNVQNDEL